MPDNECLLCGAPGGYRYCNDGCEAADNPDEDEQESPDGDPEGDVLRRRMRPAIDDEACKTAHEEAGKTASGCAMTVAFG